MRLTCEEAKKIIKNNEREMKQIESLLKKMPSEDLRCAKNGKNYKWYCNKEGSAATYLPKNNKKYAEKLALKKYYKSRYEELSQQVKGLEYYERQMKNVEGKADDLLKHEEWGKLLEHVYSIKREDLKMWMEEKYEGGAGFPEHLIHKGSQGKYLRSKSEVIIDMMLYKYGIPFRYEEKIILNNGECIYPDFTVRHPITGKIKYWEHFGMMDKLEYRNNACRRIKLYCDNGIIPSIDLIATFETEEHPLDVEEVENIIQKYFCS